MLRRRPGPHLWFFLYLGILFSPVIHGLLPSPNDIFSLYDPWRAEGPATAQNPSFNDPPTSYWTKAAQFTRDPDTFWWNPSIASGVVGHLDLLSGLWTPFVLIPILFPAWAFWSLMLVLKLWMAFWGMVLFQRSRGHTPEASTASGMLWAGCGTFFVWIFWPHTNVGVLFPWTLYYVERATSPSSSRRKIFLGGTLLGLGLAGGGFPSWSFYIVYFALLYALSVHGIRAAFLLIRRSILPALLTLVILGPSLYVAYQDLRDSGYLDRREAVAMQEEPLPAAHILNFLLPYRNGDPTTGTFQGLAGFPRPNNFHASCIYIGALAFGLFLLGCIPRSRRGHRTLLFTVILLGIVLYTPIPLRSLLAHLPGIKFTPFHRLTILLAFLISILIAEGFERLGNRRWMASILLSVLTLDLALFAFHLLPYQAPSAVKPSITPGLAWLTAHLKPGERVLPLYDSVWPNSAEYLGLNDIRSHFSSESYYREALKGIDPECDGRMGTFILFWDRADLTHPLLNYLGVRYILEPPGIHTTRRFIDPYQTSFRSSSEPFPPLDLTPLQIEIMPTDTVYSMTVTPCTFLRLPLTGEMIFSFAESNTDLPICTHTIPASEISDNVPLTLTFSPPLSQSSRILLTITSTVQPPVSLWQASENWTTARRGMYPCRPPAIVFDSSPLVRVYEGRDIRIFENRLADNPYRLTWRVTSQTTEHREFPWGEVPVHPSALADISSFLDKPGAKKSGSVEILTHTSDETTLTIRADSNTFLVTPLKWNPKWTQARLDHQSVKSYSVHGITQGYLIPRGTHELTITQGLHPRWMVLVSLGTFIIFLFAGSAILCLSSRTGHSSSL
ncbi:MAG TPA: hypothetical protein PK014_13305 [Thermoanaerobaculia bacterium]|nr:hypothetical protein [Thermoanaerobaculia bacterium]HUM30950.1 hypothetical protein [Thermoanaerobaculia bacterium]HXK69390.1 hypothetical protein [Thermoanaerobaculia bacterium]